MKKYILPIAFLLVLSLLFYQCETNDSICCSYKPAYFFENRSVAFLFSSENKLFAEKQADNDPLYPPPGRKYDSYVFLRRFYIGSSVASSSQVDLLQRTYGDSKSIAHNITKEPVFGYVCLLDTISRIEVHTLEPYSTIAQGGSLNALVRVAYYKPYHEGGNWLIRYYPYDYAITSFNDFPLKEKVLLDASRFTFAIHTWEGISREELKGKYPDGIRVRITFYGYAWQGDGKERSVSKDVMLFPL